MIGAGLVVAWIGLIGAVPQDAPAPAPAAETIAAIQIHGNNATPDADVLAASGLTIGAPFTPDVLTAARTRLLATGRFEDVTVAKRYASIVDPSRIAVVVIVDERAVRVEAARVPGEAPRIVRRGLFGGLMVLPIVDGEDGYGITYGARVAHVGTPAKGSRISAPLTWGGSRHAGLEFEQTFQGGPVSRVQAGADIEQRRNPAFAADDLRRRVWTRAERAAGPLRAGATVTSEHVSFEGVSAHVVSTRVDAAIDTRLDPALPRNAVFAQASWTHRRIDGRGVDQRAFDVRGYLGVIGQAVVVGRLAGSDASGPLPRYLQPLLGGWSSLRGFRAGAFVGDAVLTSTAELRVPLSAPLEMTRFGVSVFVDAGAAAPYGRRLAAQPVQVGAGAGVWLTATVFRIGLSAAHGRGAGTRINFGIGTTF